MRITAMSMDTIGQAAMPVIRMKNKSSAMYSRLVSAPKKSLLNLWKAGDLVTDRPAEELMSLCGVG